MAREPICISFSSNFLFETCPAKRCIAGRYLNSLVTVLQVRWYPLFWRRLSVELGVFVNMSVATARRIASHVIRRRVNRRAGPGEGGSQSFVLAQCSLQNAVVRIESFAMTRMSDFASSSRSNQFNLSPRISTHKVPRKMLFNTSAVLSTERATITPRDTPSKWS
jgi:hypothetical protein